MSMKNSSDTIGKRTRDLPTCGAVPQPTAPPAACPYTNLGPRIKEKTLMPIRIFVSPNSAVPLNPVSGTLPQGHQAADYVR